LQTSQATVYGVPLSGEEVAVEIEEGLAWPVGVHDQRRRFVVAVVDVGLATAEAQLRVLDGLVQALEDLGPMVQSNVQPPAQLVVQVDPRQVLLVVGHQRIRSVAQETVQVRSVAHVQARVQVFVVLVAVRISANPIQN